MCEAEYQRLPLEEQAQYQAIERSPPPNFVSRLPRIAILEAMASGDAGGGHVDHYNFPERGFEGGRREFDAMWSFSSRRAANHELPAESVGMVVIARAQTLREARLLERRLATRIDPSLRVHVHGHAEGMLPTQQAKRPILAALASVCSVSVATALHRPIDACLVSNLRHVDVGVNAFAHLRAHAHRFHACAYSTAHMPIGFVFVAGG